MIQSNPHPDELDDGATQHVGGVIAEYLAHTGLDLLLTPLGEHESDHGRKRNDERGQHSSQPEQQLHLF